MTLLFSFYSVCPQMFQVITPDITSFFFTKTLSFGGFSKENRPLLKRFLTGSVFYQGRAFLAFGLRHFYVNWAVNCARESYSTGLVADGFFFPYKTHCGYSFRPLGLFNIPPLGFNLIKSKPLSISRVKPYFLPHPSSPLNPTKQSPADHRIFTKIIGAIARRRRRRGWAVR